MTTPINLTQLRAEIESVPPGFDALYEIHRDDLLALIDTAEAARDLAETYTLSGGGALEMERLRETLTPYQP